MGPNLITLVILTYSYTASISASTVAGVEIVTRFDHTTKLPFEGITSRDPVNYVVIHHMPKSGGAAQGATTPQAAYYSPESCKATTVHSAQNGHMSNNRWDDIGYDFLIGDDGNIYQVRDFNSMGSPTLQHNTRSVGICMIGDSSDLKLLAKLFNILKNFLENGVANGYIARNYQLIGRSLLETILFPGNYLTKVNKT
ncbi:unnamed protein product [Hermetia illucens]|uniref:Peptidoglycan-recognition protein n=1 Tax=Hermetia illucens TaxID=343691 RepID=A0A7R8V5B9_HERIL|nr:unnamed protein product [Hermetia illucens]